LTHLHLPSYTYINKTEAMHVNNHMVFNIHMNSIQIILKKKLVIITVISFKNTLHHPLSLFYASQKVFAQRVKILKMNEQGRKGEG
jgi:hypothetical protein